MRSLVERKGDLERLITDLGARLSYIPVFQNPIDAREFGYKLRREKDFEGADALRKRMIECAIIYYESAKWGEPNKEALNDYRLYRIAWLHSGARLPSTFYDEDEARIFAFDNQGDMALAEQMRSLLKLREDLAERVKPDFDKWEFHKSQIRFLNEALRIIESGARLPKYQDFDGKWRVKIPLFKTKQEAWSWGKKYEGKRKAVKDLQETWLEMIDLYLARKEKKFWEWVVLYKECLVAIGEDIPEVEPFQSIEEAKAFGSKYRYHRLARYIRHRLIVQHDKAKADSEHEFMEGDVELGMALKKKAELYGLALKEMNKGSRLTTIAMNAMG